jgi:hypothetical protein
MLLPSKEEYRGRIPGPDPNLFDQSDGQIKRDAIGQQPVDQLKETSGKGQQNDLCEF